MKFVNKRFSGLFLGMLFLLSYADAMTGAIKPDSRYILVINSYMEANPWANNLVTGVIQYAAGDNSLFVDQVYLDLMLQDTQEELALKEESLFTRYEKKPEVVVIIGNAAWVLLRERIVCEWEDVPVILCSGMPYSLPPSKYITKTEIGADDIIPIENSVRGYNLTVIDGSIHIKKTIELIRQLVPDMKKLAFISDRMYVSVAARYEIKKICAGFFPGLELTLLTEGEITTDMLIDSLFSYDKSVGILFFSWYVKDNMWGNNYLSNNLQKTIGSLASSPVFVLRDIEVSDGNMAGGYFCTMDEYKNKLFLVLDRIMNGIPARYIPTQQAGCPSAYLNYRNLEAFGLDPTLFPSDAVYYQKPQSFYVKHKWELWIGGGLLLVLFLTIFIRLKWLRKRKELQDNELRLMSRYKDIISNMPIIYYRHELAFDKNGRLTGHCLQDTNPPFKEVFSQYQALFSEGTHDVIGLFRSEYVGLCRRVIEEQQTVSFCFYDKYQDKYYDFFIFPATQPNTIDVFGIDVTEKQQGRQLLETTNQKLAVSINVADIMPWKWDLAAQAIVFDSGNSEHPYFPEEVNPLLSESVFLKLFIPITVPGYKKNLPGCAGGKYRNSGKNIRFFLRWPRKKCTIGWKHWLSFTSGIKTASRFR